MISASTNETNNEEEYDFMVDEEQYNMKMGDIRKNIKFQKKLCMSKEEEAKLHEDMMEEGAIDVSEVEPADMVKQEVQDGEIADQEKKEEEQMENQY